MGNPRSKPLEFNILDALSLAGLPEEHRIRAIAARLMSRGDGIFRCVEEAASIAAVLAPSQEETVLLANRIVAEMKRQLRVKGDRIHRRIKDRNASLLGSQLVMKARINRVCSRIYGDPDVWRSVRGRGPVVSDPSFNWLHKDYHGVRVSGFDGLVGDVVVSGVAVKESRHLPVSFFLLPSKARTIQELIDYLGLGRRLHDDPTTVIDWPKAALKARGTTSRPWVTP